MTVNMITHLHWTNRMGSSPGLLPESILQSQHELFQVNPTSPHKLRLAQKVVRIRVLPVMGRTKRDRGEIRRLLPQSPGAQSVCVGGFDHGDAPQMLQRPCAFREALSQF